VLFKVLEMASVTANGHASGSVMEAVFPEALKSLKEADPEVYGIIEDEKARQWWDPNPDISIVLLNETCFAEFVLFSSAVVGCYA
jgi:hypothetical protein